LDPFRENQWSRLDTIDGTRIFLLSIQDEQEVASLDLDQTSNGWYDLQAMLRCVHDPEDLLQQESPYWSWPKGYVGLSRLD
jgi:hypothetical protein